MIPKLHEALMGDGTKISYSVFDGAEPAVVILHGLGGSHREFIETARALPGRKVIPIDQRGHGRSTTVPADTSRDAFVRDVVSVIEAEAPGPVDIAGQSMGAHTAMLVAADRPDLVRRLVMLEGNQGGGTAEEHAALGDYFRSWEVPFADRAAALAALGDGPLAHALVNDLEERPDGLYPRFDAEVMQLIITGVALQRWAEWEGTHVPALVIYADGGIFSEEQKAEFIQRGQNVRRFDLANASHDAHLDAFEQWIDALTRFIDVP
ncbi:pimeloyl-ACP methyl ester carboxylesterase [Okibacterium sp. HSC-33S16]|uniref:alpha/beta fold hydrolase n=1 Tax=Okibacterium sp. HSC-33S16 TaxID=2910965 RepID=UPI0020A1E1F2|nr:alpha/beta hydrolase [Okibacterium sp. HSC-33S16]MCP2030357.1 pimeloyl-ACP methyl ester carboxylesterase [Okibacterium sp. HSC-33S16]